MTMRTSQEVRSPYEMLIEKAKVNGFKVCLDYPSPDGRVNLVVGTKTVEFVRLKIKIEEMHLASRIIIDTFEEQKIWK